MLRSLPRSTSKDPGSRLVDRPPAVGEVFERDERIVTLRRARRGSDVESEHRLEFVWREAFGFVAQLGERGIRGSPDRRVRQCGVVKPPVTLRQSSLTLNGCMTCELGTKGEAVAAFKVPDWLL